MSIASRQDEFVSRAEASRILRTYPTAVHRIALTGNVRIRVMESSPKFNRFDLEQIAERAVRRPGVA